MIRFLLTCIVVVGFLILSIPVLIVEWIVGKINPAWKDISSLRIVQGAFRLCLKISGVKVTVIGEENVPADSPVLYIGNHRSFYDILLTYTRCRRPTGYVAKYEMHSIPLLSDWMRYLHCLFLNRKDLKQGMKTIMKAIEEIKSGISVCIFPEGTRNKNDDELELLPFHEGSFKVATRGHCPIIPVAMNHTSSIFEDQFPRICQTHVVLEYGKPIYPDQLSDENRKRLGAYTRNVIIEMLKKNQTLLQES